MTADQHPPVALARPAADADDAVDAAARLMGLIADEQRRAAARADEVRACEVQLRSLMTSLHHGSRDRERLDPGDGLEALHGSGQVQEWLDHQTGSLRTQVRSFIPGGGQSAQSLAQSAPRNAAVLDRGVAIRGLFLTSATHDPVTRRYVRQFTADGAQYRTVASLPLRLLLFDQDVALLPLTLDDDTLGAMVVRDRTSLIALDALFETYWRRAVPFGERPAVEPGEPSAEERALLRLLTRGERDDVVAQALGVSERTVRRMVASLTGRLGAQSRFQAGVLAHRAGWLD